MTKLRPRQNEDRFKELLQMVPEDYRFSGTFESKYRTTSAKKTVHFQLQTIWGQYTTTEPYVRLGTPVIDRTQSTQDKFQAMKDSTVFTLEDIGKEFGITTTGSLIVGGVRVIQKPIPNTLTGWTPALKMRLLDIRDSDNDMGFDEIADEIDFGAETVQGSYGRACAHPMYRISGAQKIQRSRAKNPAVANKTTSTKKTSGTGKDEDVIEQIRAPSSWSSRWPTRRQA